MSTRQKMHYKDKSPIETVETIKNLLKKLDIYLEEEWTEAGRIETHSLRLHLDGSRIGTNGKGFDSAYALASAYAEFIERLQNRWMMRFYYRFPEHKGFYYSFDEKLMSSEEVVKQDNPFINMYLESRGCLQAEVKEKAELFHQEQKLDRFLLGKENTYVTVPFYNIMKKRVDYLPYTAYSSFYGSNGMCAGNTVEESCIQGLSEIIERHVQKLLIQNKYKLPTIPENYIMRYPEIYSRYKKLMQIQGYRFILKDCSLGGRFPVAALFVIQENTGYYGLKLGCHPDYGIAMERTMTEAAQGCDITEYAGKSILDFHNEIVQDDLNIENSYKTGKAQFPYELLLEEADFPFTAVVDVHEMENSAMLKFMLERYIGNQYEVLIRDVSYLGFPSYHMIIPGFSEMCNMTAQRFQLLNMKYYISMLLQNPDLIDKGHCRKIIYTLEGYSRMRNENSMYSLYHTLPEYHFPGEEFGLGWLYLVTMCYVILEDYQLAEKKMKLFIQIAPQHKISDIVYYKAVYHYLSLMGKIQNHTQAIHYIQLFYQEDICCKIDDLFCYPDQVIKKQYPEANRENVQYDYDLYSRMLEKAKIEQIEHPIYQEDLQKLFHSYV